MTPKMQVRAKTVDKKRSKGFEILIPTEINFEGNQLTFESLLAISIEMWPDLEPDEIGFVIRGEFLRVYPTEKIPLERAVFKHTIHDGKIIYPNKSCPDRLAHLSIAIESNLCPSDFVNVFLVKPADGDLKVVHIHPHTRPEVE